MSLLIQGMKLPENYTQIVIYADGSVSVFDDDTLAYQETSAKAIEIPPHGRLIDADALCQKHYGRYGAIDEVAREAIKAALTIIPAEGQP